MSIATLTDVKTHLGISLTDTTKDTQLTAWMNAAIGGILAACVGIDFETITRTDLYQPDGHLLISRWRPIQSVTSIYEDPVAYWGQASGAFASTTLLTSGTDYALIEDGSQLNGEISRSGLIQRIGKDWAQITWPSNVTGTNISSMMRRIGPAFGAVKITYVTGYLTVPYEVTQAVCFEVDAMRQMRGKGGGWVQSEGLGIYNYSLANVDKASKPYGLFLSPATGTLLAPYLPMGIVL